MTNETKTRGQGSKTPERRAAIARAALDVVNEVGHRGLTTAAVAAGAGISERTMQYHFPTRDHLLVAALELANSDMESAYVLDHGHDGARLEVVARDFAAATMRDDRVVQLTAAMMAAATDADHPAHAYYQVTHGRALESLTRLVRLEQQAGITHPDLDPDETATQLLAIWLGLQSLWLLRRNFDLADSLNQAFRRLTGRALMEKRAILDRLTAL